MPSRAASASSDTSSSSTRAARPPSAAVTRSGAGRAFRFHEGSGLLPAPPRTPGGYRDHPDHTVTRFSFVRDAQRAGLTLAEIRSILALRDDGHAP
ncbi:MerR family DNA-binding protein [Streptomyces sp. NPDC046924]|uniref:MerR family DNA-binding protein n=1 Tax=Streptomyces sp. NPDC046924 TaxID=3155136 RepID=UPI0033E0AB07